MCIPAKINLWLEVLQRRPDGYHDLSSLMLPIAVYDRVEVTPRGRGIEVVCDAPEVPSDATNLAGRAASLYLRENEQLDGVRLQIVKEIPVAAGLGGGSADAAATLLLLNRIAAHPLSESRLLLLATQLGADVPFFLFQRPSRATGIGEILKQIQGIPSYPLVLIKPSCKVSTAAIYARLKLTRACGRIRIASLLAHPWQPGPCMGNDLESVTFKCCPQLPDIKRWLLRHGALGALMSGSGPTLFGVFRTKQQAEAVGVEAKIDWPDSWVAVTKVLSAPGRGCGRL